MSSGSGISPTSWSRSGAGLSSSDTSDDSDGTVGGEIPAAGVEERFGGRDGFGDRQAQRRHQELAEQVDRRALRRPGELLAVLFGAEHRARVGQP